mgnify:CR=1 FL=1
MSFKPSKIVLIVLLFFAIFTRFYKLNWSNDYYFHPDENNMAMSLSQLTPKDLNPHFFAYGQFPLYLGYFSLRLLNLPNTMANSILILRFYSALFSFLSLYFFYKTFPNIYFIILLIFTPGLIQLAHFGTTESLLILVFIINLFLSKLLLEKVKYKYIFWATVISAVGISTKISALFFVLPILLTLFLKKSWSIIPYLFFTFIFSLFLSPYNLISFPEFLSSMRYETAVASGALPVFYTQQFSKTIPYLFQFTHIFPYVVGLPVFIFSFFSFKKIKDIFKNKFNFIVFISTFLYFLYFAQLYVKWTRFMSPIFFIFPLLASLFIKRFPRLIFLAILPGCFFIINYFKTDTRILASNYLTNNLPPNSTLLSESGNVTSLPLGISDINTIDYDFYNDNYSPNELAQILTKSNYILVPSRRVFKNYSFPYHQNLFNGELGFSIKKVFQPFPDFLLNSENAEETWTVFDRPTLRLYQKNKPFSADDYEKIL